MIAENNDYIRKFMGEEKFATANHSPEVTLKNGLYHKSWDWLMPVISKIDEVCATNKMAASFLETQLGGIGYFFGNVYVCSNIEEAYCDVVDFIKNLD